MKSARLLAGLIPVIAAVTLAHGATITLGGTTSNETTSESLVAPFASPSGTATSNSYSGLVLITVSGDGQTSGTNFSDAFYYVSGNYNAGSPLAPEGGNPVAQSYYYLGITEGQSLSLNSAAAAPNLIVYDVASSSLVTPRYAPAYSPTNTYTFVINTALIPGAVPTGALDFGVLDGIYSDNTGSFDVSVTQLVATPEPSSLLLIGLGLLTIGFPLNPPHTSASTCGPVSVDEKNR